jgi:uncharacterized membrane protein YphA (DoxX/SURF4 family)
MNLKTIILVIIISILIGAAIFWFALKPKTAALTLSFYTFNALFLAHAATANLDLGTTAFTLFSLPHQHQKLLLHLETIDEPSQDC